MNAGERGKRAGPNVGVARPFFLAFVIVVVVALLLLGGVRTARAYSPQGGFEPNPELEGNVTFATHVSGWPPLEYTATSGTTNLSAGIDPRVPNPIVVDPADVVAPAVLQGEKVGSAYWNSTSLTTTDCTNGQWVNISGGAGTINRFTVQTVNGEPAEQLAVNTSASSAVTAQAHFLVPVASWPSSNLQFDYFTAMGYLSGAASSSVSLTANLLGCSGSSATGYPIVYSSANGSVADSGKTGGSYLGASIHPGGEFAVSVSLAQVNASGFAGDTGAGFQFELGLPKEASVTYDLVITGMTVSTSPLTLGTTWWTGGTAKTNITREVFLGNENLTSLKPSFAYADIAGGGYTAAIVQTASDLANATVTTSAVNVANATAGGPAYVEQATYDFPFGFPAAPGVTYGSFKLTDTPEVAGPQYAVVTIGGTAYTTTYAAYSPGKTYAVVASVSPTTTTYWVGVLYYTGAQWDSISAPPGIFSASGLEYWWFVLIGAILAVAGGSSAWVTRNERGLRTRRGVAPPWIFGGPYGHRRLQGGRRGVMRGHHAAAIVLGLVLAGAGGIALWSWYDGADWQGASGAFVAGLILLLSIVAIAFVVYEVVQRTRKHRS
jgi:hypothetical protein